MAGDGTGSSEMSLSTIQEDLLDAFFEQTQSFFLSGGAALAGFHLHHRETQDLDFFATPDTDPEQGTQALKDAVGAIGATIRVLQESRDFRRFLVSRADASTIVDMVIDRSPQVVAEKVLFGKICVDPVREIAANKLCALLDRTEARDFADLKLLLAGGLALEEVLVDAQRKHAGADPATLAWSLSEARIPASAPATAGLTPAALEEFRLELVQQLRRLAAPGD